VKIPQPDERSTFPTYEYTLHVGSYGGLDDRFKRKGRKRRVGFVAPRPKRSK
jgi:hypothetical protein